MSVPEIVVLLAGSVLLLIFTWQFSVKAGRFHGLYRFIAFESILILCLLNWPYWFEEPFSWHQTISWILLCGSLFPAVVGFRLLRSVGAPSVQFENTTRLVTVGLYKYIRHPLYASLMLLGLGVMFKHLSIAGVICGSVNIAAIFATALQEEKEMIQKFGLEYSAYMKKSTMFIPYIF